MVVAALQPVNKCMPWLALRGLLSKRVLAISLRQAASRAKLVASAGRALCGRFKLPC